MIRTLALLLAAAAPVRPDPHDPRHFRVESGAARVDVEVSSQHFRWRFAVLEGPAIAAVSWDMPLSYDMAVPEGWMFTYEDPHFRAWAVEPARAVGPGRTLEIVGRAGSAGGVLAPAVVTVERDQGAEPIRLPGVPAPGPRSRPLAILVVLALVGIGAVAVALSRRRQPPRTASTVG